MSANTPVAKSRFTAPATREELLALPLDDVVFMMLDTETTGAAEEGDHYGPHKIIELAVLRFSVKPRTRLRGGLEQLIDPGRPISPGSSTAHGLTDDDVSGSPTLEDVLPSFLNFVDNWPIVAYNDAFDRRMLAGTPLVDDNHVWIDAYRLAMRVWAVGDKNKQGFPLESLKQQELRYWLGLGKLEGQAHRAMADIIVTGMIFNRAVKEYRRQGLEETNGKTLGDFIRWVESPLTLRTIPIGTRSMIGKTPEELSTFDLQRIFDPNDPMYETYKRFNVDDFCRSTLVRRRANEHMDRLIPAATRKSVQWAPPEESRPVETQEPASKPTSKRTRSRTGPR